LVVHDDRIFTTYNYLVFKKFLFSRILHLIHRQAVDGGLISSEFRVERKAASPPTPLQEERKAASPPTPLQEERGVITVKGGKHGIDVGAAHRGRPNPLVSNLLPNNINLSFYYLVCGVRAATVGHPYTFTLKSLYVTDKSASLQDWACIPILISGWHPLHRYCVSLPLRES
jgi:hypothetical protein